MLKRLAPILMCLALWAPTTLSADIVAALFVGFGTSPTDDNAGIVQLDVSLRSAFGSAYNGTVYSWEEPNVQQAIEDIIGNPDVDQVVLIGHSLGGQAAANTARGLRDRGVGVDLTVQIDSVGGDGENLSDNIATGYNFYQIPIFPDLIGGTRNVIADDPTKTSVFNIQVEPEWGVGNSVISHTQIDNQRFGRSVADYQATFGTQPDLHQRIGALVLATVPEPTASVLIIPMLLISLSRRKNDIQNV